MKVLLIATNRQRSPYPVAPLGALCVAGAAQGAGHDVDVLDLAFARRPRGAIRKALRAARYDAVGLSIRNLDNCLFAQPATYTDGVGRVVDEVRRHTSAPLVLGGSGFSVAPRGWLRRLGVPWGVVGEGEGPFVDLLDHLAAGRAPDGVPGLLCRDAGSAPAPRELARHIAAPAHARCDYARYLGRGGFVSVQAKRGCSSKCIFCTYPLLEGTEHRLRAPQAVADEIEDVHRATGAVHFFFTDGVFNTPRHHAIEVCRELSRRDAPVRWMAYCNPVGFDRELAHAMAEAGCVGIEFGFDGATDKMLEALAKPFSIDAIRTSLEAAAHAGLPRAVHLLFGGPGETADDIAESQDFLASCPPSNAVFASLGIRIYEGTPLEAMAREEGVLAADADLFEPAYYVSEALGSDPMATLDAIARRRPEWSTPTDWLGVVMRLVQGIVNRTGVRPQWRDAQNYGKYMRR